MGWFMRIYYNAAQVFLIFGKKIATIAFWVTFT
jgi:hypothetical protein